MGRSCRRVDPRTALLATCLLGIAAVLSSQPEAAHTACAIGALCALVSGAWRPCIALSAAYGLIAAVMALAEGAGHDACNRRGHVELHGPEVRSSGSSGYLSF